jgi:hypothetical protein
MKLMTALLTIASPEYLASLSVIADDGSPA